MPQKYVYLLEHYLDKQPTNVGIFSSLSNAEKFLKTLPKKYEYTIYQLPLNSKLVAGRDLRDQQGLFEHWHYGTSDVVYEEYDEDGNFLSSGTRREVNWPQ